MFGERLKALRAEKGMSQGGLAEAAGLSRSGIADLEQGRREPSWSTLCMLADALGVSLDAFREKASVKAKAGRGRPKGK